MMNTAVPLSNELSNDTIQSIGVRFATERERGPVRRIESACFGPARILFGLWPRVGKRGVMSWIADVDGAPAGYLIAYDKLLDNTLLSYVGGVGVLPRYRGLGLGTRLVASVLSNQHTLWLHVRPSNVAAIGLYRKLGMRELCRVARFYADGDDAIVMATPDLAPSSIAAGDNSLIYVP